MLKNLSPLLTGELLVALDELPAGADLLIVADSTPLGPATQVVRVPGASIESVAEAVLSVIPLDSLGPAPIAFHDALAREELPDVAFAVAGIASDAEVRRVAFDIPTDDDWDARSAHAALAIRVGHADGTSAVRLTRGAS